MNIIKTLTFFLFFVIMQNSTAQLVGSQPTHNFIPKPIENWDNEDTDEDIGYYKDINEHFNKFIGVWEYSGSDKYLKIQFYKVEKIPVWDDLFFDMLFSFIEYKEKQNGQWTTIYNTFGTESVTDFSYYGRAGGEIEGGTIINSNFIMLECAEPLSEECKKRKGTLHLKYQVGSNPPQLIWERDPVVYVTDRPRKCIGIEREPFKIPANLVLTKINP